MGNLFSTDNNDIDETDERLKEDNRDEDGDFLRSTKHHNRRKSRKQPTSDVSTDEIDNEAMQMPNFSDFSNFNNDNEVTERKRSKTKRRRVSFRTTKSRGANRKY